FLGRSRGRSGSGLDRGNSAIGGSLIACLERGRLVDGSGQQWHSGHSDVEAGQGLAVGAAPVPLADHRPQSRVVDRPAAWLTPVGSAMSRDSNGTAVTLTSKLDRALR